MDPTSIARRFARALDEEDYATVARLLAPDVAYAISGESHRGPEAVVASYRAHGAWATSHLDAIRYESSVRRGSRGEVHVTFVDHVEHAGRVHTYSCEQRLRLDDRARIVSIEHVELPGELERLHAFYVVVGLAASPSRDADV